MTQPKICHHCKKEIEGERKEIHREFYTYEVCQGCYEKHLKAMAHEAWYYATTLIGIKEIHCIKCGKRVSKDDMGYSDEVRVEMTCPHCNFRFSIWHGEHDGYDYYDWQEEKEWKEYADAMNQWKENGKKGVRPMSPEERKIDEAHIRKFGEH